MQHAVDEKFMTDDLNELFTVVNEPEAVITAIQNAHIWSKGLRDAGNLR
jgi:hypothetical protein